MRGGEFEQKVAKVAKAEAEGFEQKVAKVAKCPRRSGALRLRSP